MLNLTGFALDSALQAIARYMVKLEAAAGAINIEHATRELQAEFSLVPAEHIDKLINDVQLAFNYVRNRELPAMSMLGYAKFRAYDAGLLKTELAQELRMIAAM